MSGFNNRYLWWLASEVSERVARKKAEIIEQRGRDLALLADALGSFYDHPNAPEGDKKALTEALVRLFPPKEAE